MPLDQFSRDGAPLGIRVPWHGETLWLVADAQQAEVLVPEWVCRGRIWTANELTDVLALMRKETRDLLRVIAVAKLIFNGEIAEIKHQIQSWPVSLKAPAVVLVPAHAPRAAMGHRFYHRTRR